MENDDLFTEYASAERSDPIQLDLQYSLLKDQPHLKGFLDAVPEVYLVLNDNRQIVFANKAMLKYIGKNHSREILGLRPGEALGCKHSFVNKGGCGTSEFCRNCGAVNAILNSLKGVEDIQECRIEEKFDGESADFRIWTTPYKIGDELFAIFAISDISHEKRRAVLERIFFHDILNTAGGLKGFAELMKSSDSDNDDEFKNVIYGLSVRLIEEIQAQKDLSLAETNDLSINPMLFTSSDLLNDLNDLFSNHVIANDRLIKISPESENIIIENDPVIARRVVGNMIKNALEATRVGEVVTIGSRNFDENYVEFFVHNPSFIPRSVQLQIFQRSFSTKGSGRGLGTYSMKLLTEKYLKGKITFKTSEENGTVFKAILLKVFPKK